MNRRRGWRRMIGAGATVAVLAVFTPGVARAATAEAFSRIARPWESATSRQLRRLAHMGRGGPEGHGIENRVTLGW